MQIVFSGIQLATLENLPEEILLKILQIVSQKEWLNSVRFVNCTFYNLVKQNLEVAEVSEPELLPLNVEFLCSCPKLVRLSIVLHSGSHILSVLGSFNKLKVLKLVGPCFNDKDLLLIGSLCPALESLQVYSSLQTITVDALQSVLFAFKSIKSLSLPLCPGPEKQIAGLIELYFGQVSFGHQILDCVSASTLKRPKSDYLQWYL